MLYQLSYSRSNLAAPDLIARDIMASDSTRMVEREGFEPSKA
jgi:hypothetical protein